MAKYKVKANVETMRKCYQFEDIIDIDFEDISSYGIKCLVVGMIYQETQKKSKNDIFVKIKDLEIERV